jgi:DNA gyrase/topoisomerase IV subunit A
VKRSKLSEYTTIKSKSKAIKLRENDNVIFVGISNTPKTDYVLILGKKGGLVKLLVDDIPSTGKLTIGSKGITDQAISAALCSEQDKLFTVNSSGQGKLTNISDYIVNARGASGQSITPNTVLIAKSNSNFAIIYSNKKNHFINISKISTLGKTAIGARLIPTTPNHLV